MRTLLADARRGHAGLYWLAAGMAAARPRDGRARPGRPADAGRRPALVQAAEVLDLDRAVRARAGLDARPAAGARDAAHRLGDRRGPRAGDGDHRRPGGPRPEVALQHRRRPRQRALLDHGCDHHRGLVRSRSPSRCGSCASPVGTGRWRSRSGSASLVSLVGMAVGFLLAAQRRPRRRRARRRPRPVLRRLEHDGRRPAHRPLRRPARPPGAAAAGRAPGAPLGRRGHAHADRVVGRASATSGSCCC